jgi:hypothetical protein
MENPVGEVPHLGVATLRTGMRPQSFRQGENLHQRLEHLGSLLQHQATPR